MTPQEELAALRRMAQLEEKAGGKPDFSNGTGGARSNPGKPATKQAIYNRGGGPVVGAIGGAVDGFQHHLANIPTAIAQMGANHGQWLREKLTGTKPAFADRVNDWTREREANYQARTDEAGASKAGSYAGATIGEVLPWMTGLGELRAAGMLPQITATGGRGLAQKGALLAAEGATMGAAQPVTGEGSYGAQKAAQVGVGAVAAPLLAGGAKMVGSGARYLTPGGRDAIANQRLAQLYGSDPATLAALQRGSGVDGFQFTAGQAIGTPTAVAAERTMRNGGAGIAFAERESANNAALRGEAQRLAGDDAAMTAAKQARTAATDPFYAQMDGKTVDPASVVDSLSALRNSGLGVRQNIKGAVDGVLREIDARRLPDGTIDAGVLSALRENIGSFLGPMASSQEKRALVPIKNTIVDALDGAVPGYRNNLAAYARLSQPISDMEKGRALLTAIDSGGRDAGGNQAVSLTQVKSMLARDAKSRYPMSPQARERAMAMLNAAQQRSISSNTIAAPGNSSTTADMTRAIGNSARTRIPAITAAMMGQQTLGTIPTLGLYLAGEGGAALNRNVVKRMGDKAADSAMTAQAIEQYRRALSGQGRLPYSLMQRLLPYQQKP